MNTNLNNRSIIFITLLSCLLMVSLALVNNGYANDDHFTVIEIIAIFNKFPESKQCWQCYHPKLYHLLVAKIWNIFQIESDLWKQLSAQLLNAAFGIATIFTIKNYLFKLQFKPSVLLITYSLLVLNPKFIAIFSEATNDALIIFLGNLGILGLLNILKKPSLKYSLIIILSVGLGAMTKLNFGVYFIGTIIILVTLITITKNYQLSLKRGYLGTLVLLLCLTAYALLGFNGYLENFKKEGSAFTYNTPLFELPHLYQYKGGYISGIQTIYSGYFKFHYFDLIKNPMLIPTDGDSRYIHITSHFSQIYGRTHFLYFDYWPEQWRTDSPLMRNIGSITLAIAIIPTLILLFGIFLLFKKILVSIKERKFKDLIHDDSAVHLLLILGFLAFSVLFSLFGRTYVFMKVIYLMPGLILMAKPLAEAHQFIFNKVKSKYFEKSYSAFIVGLIILYLIPVFDLIQRLYIDKMDLYF